MILAQCCVVSIRMELYAVVAALKDLNQSYTNWIFGLHLDEMHWKDTFLLLFFVINFCAFFFVTKLSGSWDNFLSLFGPWVLLFFFLIIIIFNLYVCHLLGFPFFCKINFVIQYYIYSAPELLRQFQPLRFSKQFLTFTPHSHPPTLRIISRMHHHCIFLYAYLFSSHLSL